MGSRSTCCRYASPFLPKEMTNKQQGTGSLSRSLYLHTLKCIDNNLSASFCACSRALPSIISLFTSWTGTKG